ncbi:MAG: hypothetical protein K2X66_16745, partial [Cyanobacteria bacterium]|nr:hypothetical protein [Cyanobacteriota bacterium]
MIHSMNVGCSSFAIAKIRKTSALQNVKFGSTYRFVKNSKPTRCPYLNVPQNNGHQSTWNNPVFFLGNSSADTLNVLQTLKASILRFFSKDKDRNTRLTQASKDGNKKLVGKLLKHP